MLPVNDLKDNLRSDDSVEQFKLNLGISRTNFQVSTHCIFVVDISWQLL